MDNIRKIPAGFDKQTFNKRQQWISERAPHWRSCDTRLNGSMKGLVENHIGQVSLPLGLAGPCLINGRYAKGTFYIPVATLEGTLVASMTRGCLIAEKCGGIETLHVKQEISRSPIFQFSSLSDILLFSEWVSAHFSDLKKVAERNTRYGKLLRIEQHYIHDCIILDFIYETAEAAGQNMTTFSTEEVCNFIASSLKNELTFSYLIESNFNSDKNPSTKSLIQTRGHKVVAKCAVTGRVCRRLLGCDPEALADGVKFASYGSTLANTVGVNLHVANALAGIYLATGQDVACVSENAIGILDMNYDNTSDKVVFHLTMPSITVGTVGEGQHLPQQQQNLKLLGCQGKDSSKKLAEIVCAAALAAEMSLAAAIFTNTFAKAHRLYGRKRTTKVSKEAFTI